MITIVTPSVTSTVTQIMQYILLFTLCYIFCIKMLGTILTLVTDGKHKCSHYAHIILTHASLIKWRLDAWSILVLPLSAASPWKRLNNAPMAGTRRLTCVNSS